MRSKTLLIVLSTLLLSGAAAAKERHQTISFPSATGNGSGYLSLPATGGKHPAIIVIQEWWGLNGWIRQQMPIRLGREIGASWLSVVGG